MQYLYPNAFALYPNQGKKSYAKKRFRYRLRSFLHFFTIKKFEQFVNQHAFLIPLLNSHPSYSYPIVHRFLDKRFNHKERLHWVCENLLFLPQKLNFLTFPLWQRALSFGEVIDDFEIILNINEHQAMEGFWALELRYKPNNQLVYLLTFGKVQDALLIAVIQGGNFDGSKEMVKQLTKSCFGLRPAYLMVEAMKALTETLGYKKLWGIPHQYQNKSRIVQSKRYIVNYDEIFSQSGGNLQNYWQLPLDIDKRDLNDIPTKKRSMYRKRYAMLQQLKLAMAQKLTPISN